MFEKLSKLVLRLTVRYLASQWGEIYGITDFSGTIVCEFRALPIAGGAMLKDSPEVTTPTQNMWQAVSFTTSPNKLVGVSVIDTAQNDLSLRWDPYEKISKTATFLHYEILLTSSLGEVLIRTAQQERAIISGLASGMTYAVQVKTVTTNGDSPFSNVLQVATSLWFLQA